MKIRGTVLRVLPRDVNTDEIISGKYKYDELDLEKLAVHTFESVDEKFYEDAKRTENPVLVAGENFGCGSSREQAPQVLKACGVRCIIAKSFARIFYRNAFNIGLPLVECPEFQADVGDEVLVDLTEGKITNLTKNTSYEFKPIPEFIGKILEAGGLLEYLKREGGFKI